MKTASWVLLTLLASATLLGSLASARLAYTRGMERFGPVELSELAAGRDEVALALHARRGTAAAYAAGYAALLLFVVLGPYRRREVWSWWAILASSLLLAVLVLARVPLLGVRLGSGAALAGLGIAVVALLLDASRLKTPAAR